MGRAGGAITIALDRAGYRIDQLITRGEKDLSAVVSELDSTPLVSDIDSISTIDSDVLILATGDHEITEAVEVLSGFEKIPAAILHLSGALSSDVLGPLRSASTLTGSMHPLVSMSDPISGADKFKGAYFCIEGDASDAAKEIAEQLGGKTIKIPTGKKALYHAAAVTSSGHFVALTDVAIEMLTECGLDAETSRKILLPLIGSTYENLRKKEPYEALTGPYARGDVGAFDRHLDAMKDSPGDVREIYMALALRSVEMMQRSKTDSAAYDELANAIRIAKEKREC